MLRLLLQTASLRCECYSVNAVFTFPPDWDVVRITVHGTPPDLLHASNKEYRNILTEQHDASNASCCSVKDGTFILLPRSLEPPHRACNYWPD
jgi:hypothetical protein